MISEGTYKVRAVEAALGYTGGGKEQVAVRLQITEGESAGSEITWYGYFTEKTQERTLESLRTLGWNNDDIFDMQGLGDTEATAVVVHEEDLEGKLRARVKWINAGGGLAMKERMDEGQAKAFAQRMKGAAVASRQKREAGAATVNNAVKRPAPKQTPPQQDFADDDIPF